MKKLFILLFSVVAVSTINAQGLKGLIKKVKQDTTINKIIPSSQSSGLSTADIVSGLKEALNTGAEVSTTRLSAADGFLKDAAVKILLPAEAQKVEKTLRGLGMGKLVDDAITSLNRSAEDASKKAAPIFLSAIKNMSINDAVGILRGGDTSATAYLRGTTTTELTNTFRPVIDASLAKTNATKYWATMFNAYNKVSLTKVNPDLVSYVTDKAMTGIFYYVGQEEKNIRKDPGSYASGIIKKVFGK